MKVHYTLSQKMKIFSEKTPLDEKESKVIAEILEYYTFIAIKSIAKAIDKISKGVQP